MKSRVEKAAETAGKVAAAKAREEEAKNPSVSLTSDEPQRARDGEKIPFDQVPFQFGPVPKSDESALNGELNIERLRNTCSSDKKRTCQLSTQVALSYEGCRVLSVYYAIFLAVGLKDDVEVSLTCGPNFVKSSHRFKTGYTQAAIGAPGGKQRNLIVVDITPRR